jgi:hypothetical protein
MKVSKRSQYAFPPDLVSACHCSANTHTPLSKRRRFASILYFYNSLKYLGYYKSEDWTSFGEWVIDWFIGCPLKNTGVGIEEIICLLSSKLWKHLSFAKDGENNSQSRNSNPRDSPHTSLL